MSKNTSTMALPSMLSFDRKLETSDGLMFAGAWDDVGKPNTLKEIIKVDGKEFEKSRVIWKQIPIEKPRQNRGTKSMYAIREKDEEKIEPNPVEGDDVTLPGQTDTLKLSFTMRVVGNLGEPFACNKPDFGKEIKKKVKEFKESESIHDLAFRYAYNIVNGRFLWRNRFYVQKVEIQIRLCGEETPLSFNAYDFSLKDFDRNKDDENLKKVAVAIREGLASDDDNSFTFMKVDAFVKLGKGQRVFPSQEMNMGEKKKKLFQLDGTAAMHNVKIGNAIRTIDTWYGDEMLIKAEGKGKTESVPVDVRVPIAVEPFGSVTQQGRAYRPSKNDLYSLMKSWVNGESVEADQQKYMVANLIRGGVFGGDSEG